MTTDDLSESCEHSNRQICRNFLHLAHDDEIDPVVAVLSLQEMTLKWLVVSFVLASAFIRRRRRRSQIHVEAEPESDSRDSQTVLAIGRIRTVFGNKRGVPRQGHLVPSTRAQVQLDRNKIDGESLDGLEGFTHVWILFFFSRNSNHASLSRWKDRTSNLFRAKIRPPTLLGKRRMGIFSTRSPIRPNPLGMTLARIEHVDKTQGILTVSGVDICDDTPVVDLKPYVPADRPGDHDIGFPAWVEQSPVKDKYEVTYSPEAQRMMDSLNKQQVVDQSELEEILACDVRGASQNRGQAEPGVKHSMTLRQVRFTFEFLQNRILVVTQVEHVES